MTSFGKYNAEALILDLAVFADLGTDAPTLEDTNSGPTIRLVRRGTTSEIRTGIDGTQIVESVQDGTIVHANVRALLASERYGSLGVWANRQSAFLKELSSAHFIRQDGLLDDVFQDHIVDVVDEKLVQPIPEDAARILLIDGPAGIGKTRFIQRLAHKRAIEFISRRRPLILHVQSRGRTLSHIYDLMAYSLQRIRLEVTFDQVPVLAKHGLVTIAIDGFDELADPDGYDLAWSQVSDLVASLRGAGAAILAGRETFIGRERVIRDIGSIRADVDQISVLTLQPPTKTAALNWLREAGWQQGQLDTIEEFLEPSSLALRPFFLETLADPLVAHDISTAESLSLLSMLVEALIKREGTKFGDAVEAELTERERFDFIGGLMGEVARDMAENSSVAISNGTLTWLVDVALPKEVSGATNRLIKNRSQVLAFLTNDDRPGYSRFYHEKFFEYFLSRVLIETIARGEPSKPLSRSILGSSFLETFGEVFSAINDERLVRAFFSYAQDFVANAAPLNRTSRNAASLLISALSSADSDVSICLKEISVDEARIFGTAAPAHFEKIIISQLDCRGADLSAISFVDCSLISLIADHETVLPDDFPLPTQIQDTTGELLSIADPTEIKKWIVEHLRNPPEREEALLPKSLREHPAVLVLQRACRLRQYWLRRGDDRFANRVLESDWWPLLEHKLLENNLLRVETRQASGSDARFIHIRHSDAILTEDSNVDEVKQFYASLVNAL